MSGIPKGSDADPSGPFAVLWRLVRGYLSIWLVMLPMLFIGFGSQLVLMGAWWGVGRLLEGTSLPSGPFYAVIALVGILWVFWMLIRFIGPLMNELQDFMRPPSNLVKLNPSTSFTLLGRHLAALKPSLTAVRVLQEELRKDVWRG